MPAHSIHGLCLYDTMRCDMDPIRFIRFILYSGYKQCFSLPFADGCVCVLFVPNLFSTFGTYFCGRETPTKKCVLLIFHFIRSLARFIRFDSGQTYWWRTKLVYTKYIGHLMLVFPFVFHFPPADTCAVFYSPFLEFICFFSTEIWIDSKKASTIESLNGSNKNKADHQSIDVTYYKRMYRVRIADDGGDRSWIQMAIMGISCFALFMLTWRLLNFLEPNSMLQTARSTCNETINARIKIEESEEG